MGRSADSSIESASSAMERRSPLAGPAASGTSEVSSIPAAQTVARYSNSYSHSHPLSDARLQGVGSASSLDATGRTRSRNTNAGTNDGLVQGSALPLLPAFSPLPQLGPPTGLPSPVVLNEAQWAATQAVGFGSPGAAAGASAAGMAIASVYSNVTTQPVDTSGGSRNGSRLGLGLTSVTGLPPPAPMLMCSAQ